jgi:AcrR family transcriptional regulator
MPTSAAPPRATAADSPAPGDARSNAPEATMANILEVATAEFAAKGLSGARIDEIAQRTRTSKRMIYYYFDSKEGLYLKVLEEAYRRIRLIESQLQLDALEPEAALRELVHFTMGYQWANQDFIRLVMNENMHRGSFLKHSPTIRTLNLPAIASVRTLYQRGVAGGVFRPGLDPLDLHMTISALSVFNVANQYTFTLIFERPIDVQQRAEQCAEMLVRYLRP